MIGSLRGVLLDRVGRKDGSGEVIVEVGGVGYRVVVPAGALHHFGELGAGVFVHVHTHVREDALVLYGFPSRDERVTFEALIGAHGVGPALALALLSAHSPNALRRAVAADDVDALTIVSGVGPKTATRLIIELKSRLELDLDDPGLALAGSTAGGPGVVRGEVRAALVALGYGADEVRLALGRLPEAGAVEDLIRQALQELSAAR